MLLGAYGGLDQKSQRYNILDYIVLTDSVSNHTKKISYI